MNEKIYLAHRAEDGREQTVLEHLTGTAELCERYAASFDAAEQGRLAGLAHDIGKYSDAFQRHINGSPEHVDHSTAGALECFKLRQAPAAFAVAGHHGGLPDGGGSCDLEAPTLWGRLNRAKEGKLEDYSAWQSELSLPRAKPPRFRLCEDEMFYTRMLYSCLVDADFLDTEGFMSGQPREQEPGSSVEELWNRLSAHISGWFPPANALNEQRCAILRQCIAQGESRGLGLFTLTVPTGGGKTVASLAFALAHAKAHGLRRVIYVIPYTSIIEQTAAKFRDILGRENVLEHHSNVPFDLEDEANAGNVRRAKATENWDMPVIVTTAVQFFESLFACKSSQCRKLHNIAQSVIIFDEAQMLPLPVLRPCVYAISQLVARYRVSAVLCTATQPALNPVFQDFLPDISPAELCPPDTCDWEVFRRVRFERAGRLQWDELARRLNAHRQVLCVVNARKSAQDVFSRLNGEGCFHLSTLMVPAHRQAKLEEIRRRLEEGLPCRVVSTSLIEAGVDVDFPVVFREEAGLDSVLQAAGRCNREGKRAVETSAVTVFQGEGRPPRLFATSIEVGRMVMERHGDITSREAVHDYFKTLLAFRGNAAQDNRDIMALLCSSTRPFRKIAEKFHMLDQRTRTVYIPEDQGAELVERLRSGERTRRLFRQLGHYGVAIYEDHFERLENAGDLEILDDGSAILINPTLYDSKTGLALEAEEGKAYMQ